MMRFRQCCAGCAALALVLSAGCDDSGVDRVLDIRAQGSIAGVTYLDRNGNGLIEPTDGPVSGVAVRFTPVGSSTIAVRSVSNPTGTFVVPTVDVGEYQVGVESGTVPDSLQLIRIDSLRLRVTANDTASVVIALSFPTLPARQVRAAALGKRLFVEGITLNSWATFGDSTLHVADSSGVLRATRVAVSNVVSGQRVRLLGTTDLRAGQPTLTDAVVFALGSGQLPSPTRVNSAAAARADGGRLDAALVQVVRATILGGQNLPTGDFQLTVNDGSGLLEVVIDRNAGISNTTFVAGALLDATGLLVPGDDPGEWQLKPRATSDLAAAFPSATVAQVRQMDPGKVVSIEGVALNGWVTFADATVHMADSTGAIRTINVPQANLFAGDRVRLIGTVGFSEGQRILSLASFSPTVLGPGLLPLPRVVSTMVAAHADSAKLDAALVKIIGGVIADTATIAPFGDFRVRVNDGTGLLEVLLDRDSGFQLSPFVPGATLDVTGLLTPLPGGRDWRLKPRQSSDIVVVR
jgi:hypothetical protein